MYIMSRKEFYINNSCIEKLRDALAQAEAVVIGAGAGLSTAAGFTYNGERFNKYFGDFEKKYGFKDMYSGGFYPFRTLEEHWAYWSRYIYINRYMDAPKPLYQELFKLVEDKDYFVITTNVDHCFQKAGFDKHRLFYTQGDYGLFQCSGPCHQITYENGDMVRKMVESQGYVINVDGILDLPEDVTPKMVVPSGMVPYCPRCHKPMSMNLRADDTFVEDDGWYQASRRYEGFLHGHKNLKVLFLELAVGFNTPGIIKFEFWRMVHKWKNAEYVCINAKEAYAPEEIRDRSVCIQEDIAEVLKQL